LVGKEEKRDFKVGRGSKYLKREFSWGGNTNKRKVLNGGNGKFIE